LHDDKYLLHDAELPAHGLLTQPVTFSIAGPAVFPPPLHP
jgi:hypothetical protein